jgi:hypothetical protein
MRRLLFLLVLAIVIPCSVTMAGTITFDFNIDVTFSTQQINSYMSSVAGFAITTDQARIRDENWISPWAGHDGFLGSKDGGGDFYINFSQAIYSMQFDWKLFDDVFSNPVYGYTAIGVDGKVYTGYLASNQTTSGNTGLIAFSEGITSLKIFDSNMHNLALDNLIISTDKPTAVPEPSGLLLVVIGMSGFGLAARLWK